LDSPPCGRVPSFASLAFGAFYCAVPFRSFYEFINFMRR
jgi:hypothetical protein